METTSKQYKDVTQQNFVFKKIDSIEDIRGIITKEDYDKLIKFGWYNSFFLQAIRIDVEIRSDNRGS